MKKFLFALLLCSQFMNAQDTIPKSALANRKNEFHVDLVSLIALSKLNLTYERFLNKDFSVGLSGSYANSKKVNDDFDEGNRNTMPKYEITPFVRYSLSKSLINYYFVEIFASANGGDYRETVRLNDGFSDYYAIQKSDYFDVAAGAAIGYKMYIKEKFGIELLVGFGRNLIDTDKSPDVISRVGLSFGYRF
ncbi:MAG TPA: DUF3575 domain-containing protein [Flavobacterium sp.]|nr:DUF3575 domain-containing protein [Flavobacterium sp.]